MSGPDLEPADQPLSVESCRHRWPSGAEKAELLDGSLVFSGDFDERDLAAARRVYPGRRVELEDGALWVRPAAS